MACVLRIAFARQPGAGDPVQGEAAVESSVVEFGVGGHGGADARFERVALAAPRYGVFEEGIAVRGAEPSVVRGAPVVGRDVGVVVAGEKTDGGHPCAEEATDRLDVRGGHAGLVVAGVPVEPELVDALEQRFEILEPAEARGGVAEVQIGEDAQHGLPAKKWRIGRGPTTKPATLRSPVPTASPGAP